MVLFVRGLRSIKHSVRRVHVAVVICGFLCRRDPAGELVRMEFLGIVTRCTLIQGRATVGRG